MRTWGSMGTYFSEDSLLRQVLGTLNPEPVNPYEKTNPILKIL